MKWDFSKSDSFLKFFKECESAISITLSEFAMQSLIEAVKSAEAAAFTIKMNELYKVQNTKDDNGNIKKISTPADLGSRMEPEGENTWSFIMSLEEDRWFRANQLFGDDILGKLGFKYTNIG